MAAFVAETPFTETAQSTTATLTPGNVAGDLLVLWFYTRVTVTVSSVVDTGGNTWQAASIAVSNPLFCWYSMTAFVAGTITITVNTTCSFVASCMEFSGGATSSASDVYGAATGTSTSPSSGAVGPTTQATEIITGFIGQNGTGTLSGATGGFTTNAQHTSNIAGNAVIGQSAYQFASSTGSFTFGATSTTSAVWQAGVATFKESGGVVTAKHEPMHVIRGW